MERKSNYSYCISLLRIFSMICIIVCHIASRKNYIAISQFFNVGVPIFALISGYLYGSKNFTGSLQWLGKRYIRLAMPTLAWTIAFTISALIRGSYIPKWYQYLFLLFQIQGLNFILRGIKDIFIGPWFFTSILCCYIALWIYTSLERKYPKIQNIFNYGGIVPLTVFALLGLMNISIGLLLIFFIGYRLAKLGVLECKPTKLLYSGVAMFFTAVAVRLCCKRVIDGSLLYDNIIVTLTHIGIAISSLCAFKWFELVAPKVVMSIGKNKFVRHLDKISIYVYISHDWYINGIIATMFDGQIPPIVLYPLYFVLVVITSSALYFVFENIGNVLPDYIFEEAKNDVK